MRHTRLTSHQKDAEDRCDADCSTIGAGWTRGVAGCPAHPEGSACPACSTFGNHFRTDGLVCGASTNCLRWHTRVPGNRATACPAPPGALTAVAWTPILPLPPCLALEFSSCHHVTFDGDHEMRHASMIWARICPATSLRDYSITHTLSLLRSCCPDFVECGGMLSRTW